MRTRLIFISLTGALLAATVVTALWELNRRQRPNVLVLTVESARFDAISDHNTPFIWRMAASSHRFIQHRTSSAWTGSNIVSILTGLSTFRHGVHSRDASIPKSWLTPLEFMAESGWDIGGVQSFMLTPGFQNLGLTVTPAANSMAWMASRRLSQTPFLFWHHYLDTHLPYNPPNATRITSPLLKADPDSGNRMNLITTSPTIPARAATFNAADLPTIRALYDGQFGVFDAWFESLWTFLDKSGLLETTIVILTTDHGEELLERGYVGHASTTRTGHLHEEITHIPLMIWLPPALRDGDAMAEITAPSSHIDIMPTIFNLLGLIPETPFDGADLFSLPTNRVWSAVTSKAGFAEDDPAQINDFIAAIMEDGMKAQLRLTRGVVTDAELYDLSRDPKERQNRTDAEPDVMARLTDKLMRQVLTMRIAKPSSTSARPADQTMARNKAPPRWVFPASSGVLTYDDLPSPLTLRWRGEALADYVLQYEAGVGPMAIRGEIHVAGTTRDFGVVSRHYWNEYVTPYKRFRLRIRQAGQTQSPSMPWSPWLDLEVRK
jgi:choline-sulfatase